jgi:diguanylate cyclase (GGDEF)-like protein
VKSASRGLLLLLAVIIVIAEGLHWTKLRRQADAADQSACRSLASSGAALLRGADGGLDLANSSRWAKSALRNPAVLFVGVTKSDGHFVAQYPPGAAALADVASNVSARNFCGSTEATIANQHLRLMAAVAAADPPSAEKLVLLMRAEPRPLTWSGVLESIVAPALLAFGGMWAGAHWLRKHVGAALERLSANVDEHSLEVWQRIAQQRNDELGRIAARLHETTVEMSRACDRAMRLERSLDRRVIDQTRDVHTALKRTEKQVWTDALTQLGNRRALDDRLEGLFNAQSATGSDLTIVMFDVDNFKAYNDKHGHTAGDELLKFVGELLRGSLRSTDLGIRYGGDEFAVLLVDMDARSGRALAERMVRLFNQRTAMLPADPPVTMSAGVASLRTDAPTSGAQLLELADKVLYAAKRAGKNRAVQNAERVPT